MSERELHKPGTPGPWEWQEVSDHVSDYALVRSVAPDHDGEYVAEIRAGLEEADAAAIADLWQWIERAEKYEEALAANSEWVAHAVTWRALETKVYDFEPSDDDVQAAERRWTDLGFRDVATKKYRYQGDWYLRVYGEPPAPVPGLFTDRPGLAEQTVTWTAIALAGWGGVLFAHLVFEAVVRVLGVRGSVVVAAAIGAVAGVVAWVAAYAARVLEEEGRL